MVMVMVMVVRQLACTGSGASGVVGVGEDEASGHTTDVR